MSTPTATDRGLILSGDDLDDTLKRDAMDVLRMHLTWLAASFGDGNLWSLPVWERLAMAARAGRALQRIAPDGWLRPEPVALDAADIAALRDAAQEVSEIWGGASVDGFVDPDAEGLDEDEVLYRAHRLRLGGAADRVLLHLGTEEAA